MPIPLGVLAVAGASSAAAGSFDLLETVILGSDTASVTFSNLNTYSDYKHLQIRTSLQATDSNFLCFRYNGSSAVEYAAHRLSADGSSVASQADPGNDKIIHQQLPIRGNDSNVFLALVFDILNFNNTTTNKTLRGFIANAHSSYRRSNLISGFRANTSALTSVQIFVTSNAFSSGSRFSLYGIKG